MPALLSVKHYFGDTEMKILAVADNDQSSVFYWANLDIRSAPLENSETAILKTLRGGVEVPRRVM